MLLTNSSKSVSFRVRSTSPLGENLGGKYLEKEPVSLSEKLQSIGSKSKSELLREKDAAREAAQFGKIPAGEMRRRAESDLSEVRSDPVPSDLIDVHKWADDKRVSHRYVRALIKRKIGSLPLVGGSLQYSLEALEALWRNDYQTRREKGINKSAAATYKAEKMKLGLELLDGSNLDSLNDTVSAKLKALELGKTNLEISEQLLSSETELQELRERIGALEIDNARLSLESNRLIDKIIEESDQELTREAVLAQAQAERLKESKGKVVPIEDVPSEGKGKQRPSGQDADKKS